MSRSRSSSRTALLVTLGALGVIPVATGLLGIAKGPAGAPGGGPTTASVDSEYRFVNVFWAAAGGVLWWSLGRPDQRSTITRLVLTLASIGGVPRLVSWRAVGRPHPVFVGTVVLELVVLPLVLVWHARVVGRGDGRSRRR